MNFSNKNLMCHTNFATQVSKVWVARNPSMEKMTIEANIEVNELANEMMSTSL